ncbi:MAG: response regulator [Candidatus Heimdallarchaeota archaeon]
MRILLVDDDENLLETAKRVMKLVEPTFELTTAVSASKAFEILVQKPFDVIVSDYQMPGFDGLHFLESLRKTGCETAFILFTGQGSKEVANRAIELGADYYLKKEGSSRELFRELTHIIRKAANSKQMNIISHSLEYKPCIERN